MTVSRNAALVISSVGYISKEVTVGSESVIDMAMTPDIRQLEELVMVGYGTQDKAYGQHFVVENVSGALVFAW